MKIKVDIECSAKEARELMGLPDLEPLQKEILGEYEKVLKKNLSMIDSEKVMATWFSGLHGVQDKLTSFLETTKKTESKRSSKPRSKRTTK